MSIPTRDPSIYTVSEVLRPWSAALAGASATASAKTVQPNQKGGQNVPFFWSGASQIALFQRCPFGRANALESEEWWLNNGSSH
jgi:hypothetical protein